MLTLPTPHFRTEFDNAWKASPKRAIRYQGKLLVPGEDAAVVVTPDSLQPFINAAPALAEHPFTQLVTLFAEEIREATANEFGLFNKEVIVVGRWHINGPDDWDFEPYIVRRIGRDGTVTSHKYDYTIFPCDGLRSGEGFSMTFDPAKSGIAARNCLTLFSDDITTHKEISERAIITVGLPRGAVWYPSRSTEFPILVTERPHIGIGDNEAVAQLALA